MGKNHDWVPNRATTFRVSDDLHELLSIEASRRGISVGQLVRDAVVFYVAWHAARDAGKPADRLAGYGELMRRLAGPRD